MSKSALLSNIISLKNLQCLELSLSEVCNYKCSYCTFWRNFSDSKKNLLMNIELARAVVVDFLEQVKSRDDALIYFGTAEPLLNWKVLQEIIIFARELRPDIRLNLITNGSLLNKSKLTFFRDNNVNVGISLDGRETLQRRQRIPTNGKVNSFDVVMKNLELAQEIGLKFSCLSGTFRSLSAKDDIAFLISLCVKYQIKELALDFDVDSLLEVADLNELSKMMIDGYLLAKRNGLDVFGYWMIPYYNTINKDVVYKTFCGNAIGESVCVSSDGKFKLCGYDNTSIMDYTNMPQIFSSTEVQKVYENLVYKEMGSCTDCSLKNVCCGQCMMNTESSEVFKRTCEFYKIVTSELLNS